MPLTDSSIYFVVVVTAPITSIAVGCEIRKSFCPCLDMRETVGKKKNDKMLLMKLSKEVSEKQHVCGLNKETSVKHDIFISSKNVGKGKM